MQEICLGPITLARIVQATQNLEQWNREVRTLW